MDVTAIHEEVPDVAIANPRRVEQTIIKNQEVAGIDGRCAPFRQILGDLLGNELLTFENVADDERCILFVDEHRRNDLAVELIGSFCARNHGAAGQALVVPEEVFDQERLARFTLANENNNLVVLNLGHIEFP